MITECFSISALIQLSLIIKQLGGVIIFQITQTTMIFYASPRNVFELYELCNYKNSFIALIKVW